MLCFELIESFRFQHFFVDSNFDIFTWLKAHYWIQFVFSQHTEKFRDLDFSTVLTLGRATSRNHKTIFNKSLFGDYFSFAQFVFWWTFFSEFFLTKDFHRNGSHSHLTLQITTFLTQPLHWMKCYSVLKMTEKPILTCWPVLNWICIAVAPTEAIFRCLQCCFGSNENLTS